MKTMIYKVTPTLAAEWLKSTKTINRPINKPSVAQFAYQMTTGKWKEGTGEAIKFGRKNGLIDGFHRLNAIVKSGVTVEMLIITEIDDSVFDVLDQGRKRTGGDVLGQCGVKSAKHMAAGIALWNRVRVGNYGKAESGNELQKVTPRDIRAIYLENKDSFEETARMSSRFYDKFRGMKHSEYFALIHILKENFPVKTEMFFSEVTTGANISITNPAFHLREWLIKQLTAPAKMAQYYRFAYIITAWNAYVLDKEIKILRFQHTIQEIPNLIK